MSLLPFTVFSLVSFTPSSELLSDDRLDDICVLQEILSETNQPGQSRTHRLVVLIPVEELREESLGTTQIRGAICTFIWSPLCCPDVLDMRLWSSELLVASPHPLV